MFLRMHFYLLKMPKITQRETQEAPKRPQEAPRGPQGGPTGRQEEPNTAPGQPKDSSKTAPKRPKSCPRTFLTIPGPPSTVHDRSGCSKKSPRGPQDPSGCPPRTPQGAQEGFKRALRGVNLRTFRHFPVAQTFNSLTPRGGVSPKLYIYMP